MRRAELQLSRESLSFADRTLPIHVLLMPMLLLLFLSLQEELQLRDTDEGDWMEDDDMGDLFGFDAAAAAADEAVAALMPALGPQVEGQQEEQQPEQRVAQEQQVRQRAAQILLEGGAAPASVDPQPGSDPSIGEAEAAPGAADAPGPSAATAHHADPPATAAGVAAAAGAAGDRASYGSSGGSHRSGSGSGPIGHGGMRLRRGMSPLKFSRWGWFASIG